MELILRGNNREKASVQRPLTSSISGVVNACKEYHRGKIDLYDLGITARIPTEFQGSYLIYQILGNCNEALIVSPNGCTATRCYYKPVNDLKTDTGESGVYTGKGPNRVKHTEEDTERFWLLNTPEFRKELADANWMIFPEIKSVEDSEQLRLGASFASSERYKRAFKIKDFIRAMELVSSPNPDQRDYTLPIKDLKELSLFGEEIEFQWRAGGDGYGSFFHMPIVHNNTPLPLILEEVRDAFPYRSDISKNTLTRIVLLDLPISREGYTSTLISDYANQKKINQTGEWLKDGNLRLHIRDRNYSGAPVEAPNTGALLNQALDLRSFTQRILQEQGKETRELKEAELTKRRKQFGIELTIKK